MLIIFYIADRYKEYIITIYLHVLNRININKKEKSIFDEEILDNEYMRLTDI